MRTFPILLSPQTRRGAPVAVAEACPAGVSWDMVAPHEAQAKSNHGGQSLLRLAERGGLAPCELLAVLEDRRWRPMPLSASVRQILAAVAAWEQEREQLSEPPLPPKAAPLSPKAAPLSPGRWLVVAACRRTKVRPEGDLEFEVLDYVGEFSDLAQARVAFARKCADPLVRDAYLASVAAASRAEPGDAYLEASEWIAGPLVTPSVPGYQEGPRLSRACLALLEAAEGVLRKFGDEYPERLSALSAAVDDARGVTLGGPRRADPPKWSDCPGPGCLACSGEACSKCGAGLNVVPGRPKCEHDVAQRHEDP